jgi:hypothetical protein
VHPTLPLTPRGKVDRQALPAPEYDGDGYTPPRTPVEEIVAAIWADVLSVPRVGASDNFFRLGGHSLLATRVVSRVAAAFTVEIPLRLLFEHPVLGDFAGHLPERQATMRPPIEPAADGGTIPLSYAQQRLWFLEQLGGRQATYHISKRLRLVGPLDRGALERALERIVERHAVLRTVFPVVDGEPVQRIIPHAGETVLRRAHDVRGLAHAESALRDLLEAEATAAFDLAEGPLLRGCLIRVGD